MKETQNEVITSDNEEGRLGCLLNYGILDSEVEQDFDELTHLASLICETPIALVTLLDKDRQWFKSNYGIDLKQTERCYSFCHFTILTTDIFEVYDSYEDVRFVNNPLVTGPPYIRHYCGAPLINPEGFRLGALCVIDRVPKKLSSYQKNALAILAKQVVTHFELRKQKNLLEKEKQKLQEKVEQRTKALNEINAELNTFIYKASHDLRGPLATIMGLSSLGLSNTVGQESGYYFDKITNTSNKLDKILRNLSIVVQLKEHQRTLIKLNREEIKEEIEKFLRPYNDSVGVEVSIAPDINLQTDIFLFDTVLENIIENSISFKKDFDKLIIKISIEQKSDITEISVQDNGEGIEEESYSKIFNMFFRANNKSRGSGLGLFIVKKAIALLEGEIRFKSKLHVGSTFIIALPKLSIQ